MFECYFSNAAFQLRYRRNQYSTSKCEASQRQSRRDSTQGRLPASAEDFERKDMKMLDQKAISPDVENWLKERQSQLTIRKTPNYAIGMSR
jgi:hypothetical protein